LQFQKQHILRNKMAQYGWGTSGATGGEWFIKHCKKNGIDPSIALQCLLVNPSIRISEACGTLYSPNCKQEAEIRNLLYNIHLFGLEPWVNKRSQTQSQPHPETHPETIYSLKSFIETFVIYFFVFSLIIIIINIITGV
jgi:hypothetical protein